MSVTSLLQFLRQPHEVSSKNLPAKQVKLDFELRSDKDPYNFQAFFIMVTKYSSLSIEALTPL